MSMTLGVMPEKINVQCHLSKQKKKKKCAMSLIKNKCAMSGFIFFLLLFL